MGWVRTEEPTVVEQVRKQYRQAYLELIPDMLTTLVTPGAAGLRIAKSKAASSLLSQYRQLISPENIGKLIKTGRSAIYSSVDTVNRTLDAIKRSPQAAWNTVSKIYVSPFIEGGQFTPIWRKSSGISGKKGNILLGYNDITPETVMHELVHGPQHFPLTMQKKGLSLDQSVLHSKAEEIGDMVHRSQVRNPEMYMYTSDPIRYYTPRELQAESLGHELLTTEMTNRDFINRYWESLREAIQESEKRILTDIGELKY